ncbi:MAG TPA: Mur ligase family protein [Desulfosporosinus sp.]|nr:Mur ligase family protein [Desulfosporosinus sp.]
MKPFSVGQIRKLVNGVLIQGPDDLLIMNAVYYLRKMKKPNTLLFLRSKWKVDWDVIQRCAPCAVVTDKLFEDLSCIDGCTIILVENTETAYWQFIEHYRNLFQIPVIAVTGTCGKTTTKDMIKHILKNKFKVYGTNASANGRTGNFSYLMGIDETTEVAVFETAVGKPGDITNSSNYFKPIIGIITNIGVDHLDGCKTVNGYIQAKGEMVSILGDEGILIVNADDEKSKRIGLDKFRGRIVYFGIHSPSEFQASEVYYGENGMDFILTFENMKYPMFVPGYGEHQVYNALAALAAVHEVGMGIGMREAAERLRIFHNMVRHLEMVPGIAGSMILDDTWKININSLEAAFKVLHEMGRGKKRMALLGSLTSLGNWQEEVYLNAGEMIAQMEVDVLISVGKMAGKMVGKMARYAEAKAWSGEVYAFVKYDDAYRMLKQILDEHCILLIKGDMYDKSMISLAVRLRDQ